MKTKFELQTAIEKWCTENGHDGFYLNDRDCVGGKLSTTPFVNDDGDECDWSIQPHEEGTK